MRRTLHQTKFIPKPSKIFSKTTTLLDFPDNKNMKILKFPAFCFVVICFFQLVCLSQTSEKSDKETARFVKSGNLSQFVQELNELGKIGYRVEKSFNYGGNASRFQGFAAVLKLEEGNTYEYDWLTSPNKNFLEGRLNNRTEYGFYPVEVYGITACDNRESAEDKNPDIIDTPLLKLSKGDVFLLERKNGIKQKLKNYRVFTADLGLGKNPSEKLQTALDQVSAEYVPFKILFNKGGALDFSVSVVVEDDFTKDSGEKTDYKFVKEVRGFEKEVNLLAKNGYRFLTGRRIGLIKYVVMAKNSAAPTSYIFVDQEKYEKETTKPATAIAAYQAKFIGDSDCDSDKSNGDKILFEEKPAKTNSSIELKYLKLADTDEENKEVKKLLKEGFIIKDGFFENGIVLILEKI